MSKFSLEVLNRCVYPYIQVHDDEEVLLGSSFGEDVSLTRIHEGILVSHIDPIVGAVEKIGRLAVHVACNDIATSGALPKWLLPLVLIPNKENTDDLQKIMADIHRAAADTGAKIIGGHTGYSDNLKRPLVAITALGTLYGKRPIQTKGARNGDHIFISKGIALEGTAILANDFSSTAKRLGIDEKTINEGRELFNQVSILPESQIFAAHGATCMHDVTRGGLLETLLEIASLSNVHLVINSNKIPIPTVVARFSQAFDFEPLQMISSGTLAACIPEAEVIDLKKSLKASGILFADIGFVVEGNGVEMLQNGSSKVFTQIQSEYDELARMWEEYKYDP